MDQVKIGSFIAKKRKEKGLTQNQLGELLGVSGKTISRWETAKYMPDLSMLIPLSECLGIGVHELLKGEEIENVQDDSARLTLEYSNYINIHKQKYKTMKCIIYLLLLFVQFFICRYVFFEVHGMKELPLILLELAVSIVIVSIYSNYEISTIFISLGYGASFLIGYLFNQDGFDPGGGKTNNLWILWMFSYLFIICIGFILDILKKKRKFKSK